MKLGKSDARLQSSMYSMFILPRTAFIQYRFRRRSSAFRSISLGGPVVTNAALSVLRLFGKYLVTFSFRTVYVLHRTILIRSPIFPELLSLGAAETCRLT